MTPVAQCRSLNFQLALRLGGLLLLILAGLIAVGLWTKGQINAIARSTQLANARTHYTVVLADLNRHWGQEAFNLRTRIEALDILDKMGQRNEKLMTLLISHGGSLEFPALHIEKTSGERLAAHHHAGPIDAKIKFSPGQNTLWFQNPRDGHLYLAIRQFIWLGKENGHLILFKPLDHALVTQLTYPGTRLSLWWKGQPVASSDGEDGVKAVAAAFSKAENSSNAVALTWSGPESENSPRLLVETLANELIETGSIAGPVLVVFILLLTGVSVGFAGLWRKSCRQLDALVRAEQRYAALGRSDDHIAHDLGTARDGPVDAATTLAAALGQRIKADSAAPDGAPQPPAAAPR